MIPDKKPRIPATAAAEARRIAERPIGSNGEPEDARLRFCGRVSIGGRCSKAHLWNRTKAGTFA
jgi:hypothetical protein